MRGLVSRESSQYMKSGERLLSRPKMGQPASMLGFIVGGILAEHLSAQPFPPDEENSCSIFYTSSRRTTKTSTLYP